MRLTSTSSPPAMPPTRDRRRRQPGGAGRGGAEGDRGVGMGPAQAIRTGLGKSFQFSGRASRSEFWWFFAAWAAVVLCLMAFVTWTQTLLPGHLTTIVAWKCLKAAVVLLFLLPLGISARRHHDSGIPALLSVAAAVPGLVLVVGSLLFIPALLGLTAYSAISLFAIYLLVWQIEAFVLYFLLIALSALVALWPTQTATNRYGPPPFEVTR
jgi:uncharacterized membrane protein YhaH (DUF805 family)